MIKKSTIGIVCLISAVIIIVTALLFISFTESGPEFVDGDTVQVITAEYTTLAEYNASIDRSCEVDSDCVIKDIQNCCGYFPRCVSVDAQVDPDFVHQACADEGKTSICGFPVIESCGCQNNVCVSN